MIISSKKISSLNERQLAELIENNTLRNEVKVAQIAWTEKISNHNKGNRYFSESNHPNYYAHQIWYNQKTDAWEEKGRTMLISMQQFLSAKFDESYWGLK